MQELPLARIKKIMKLDEDVKVGAERWREGERWRERREGERWREGGGFTTCAQRVAAVTVVKRHCVRESQPASTAARGPEITSSLRQRRVKVLHTAKAIKSSGDLRPERASPGSCFCVCV